MGMTGHAPQFEAERGPSLRSLYAAKCGPDKPELTMTGP